MFLCPYKCWYIWEYVESNLENLAADRESWRSTCAAGLKNLSAASEQVASDRRARRHATPAGPACPQCGRICASDFGLCSHLRSHRRPQKWHSSSTTSWSKSTDYHKQASMLIYMCVLIMFYLDVQDSWWVLVTWLGAGSKQCLCTSWCLHTAMQRSHWGLPTYLLKGELNPENNMA